MASNVSELVVSLGLNTASFTQKINEVNRTMKLVESQFKNSGAGVKDFEKSAEGLSGKLATLNSKLDGASTKIKLYNDEIKKTKSALDEKNQTLKESKEKVEDLTKKYEESVNTLGKNANATKELKEQLSLAEKELTKNEKAVLSTSNKLKTLETNLNSTEAEFKDLTEQVKTTQSTINAFSWNKLSENLNDLSNKFEVAGDKLISVGKTMSIVSTAIIGLGTGAVKTAVDFEYAMRVVQATADASAEDLEKLTDKALEMGIKTVFSATESAEALNYMAQAGWNTQQMIDGLEGVMNLAAASGEELGLVSDIVTDSLTSFGMSAQQSGEFADILAKAAAASNTNVAMMGETFKYVAPVAGALGFNAYDTSVAIGLMANAGIKASMAGTSLRQIMTNLGEEVVVTGKNIGEVSIATVDAEGNMRSFHDILVDLRSAYANLTESEKAANAETLAGKTGMSGLLAIVNATEQDFNNLTSAINNSAGASEKMAEIMNSSTQGQFKLLMSQVEGIAISLGNLLLPAINNVVGKISEMLTWFEGLDESTKKTIITISGVVAAIGPLLIAFGSVSKGISNIIGLGGDIAKVMAKLAAGSATAGASMASSAVSMGTLTAGLSSFAAVALPVVGVVAAVGAGIAVCKTNTDLMNGSILETTDDMGPLKRALDALNGGFSKSKEELQAMGLIYKDFNENISDTFKTKVEESTKSLNEFALYLKEINFDDVLSDDELESFDTKINLMVDGTIATIKARQEEVNKSMNEMFISDGVLSENEEKVLEILNKTSELQIEETTKLKDEINRIKAVAIEEGRVLNEEEIASVNEKLKRIKQLELESLGTTQEEIEFAKNEFNARVASIDLEGAQKLLADKQAIREEEKIQIAAHYDTNIQTLKNHLATATGEEKTALEEEIKNAEQAKADKLKIQDDLWNEYLRILGEKNPQILEQINKFNGELLSKQDLKAQENLTKIMSEYEGINQITEDGLYRMYNANKNAWRDVRVEVDESTGEILGVYDTYSGKSGGYTASVVDDLKNLQTEYARWKYGAETSLNAIEGATVDAEGNMVNSMGNIIGKLEDVQEEADGTKTGILDLNGTPIEIKTNSNSVIDNLIAVKNAIFDIPTHRSVTVDAVSGAGFSGRMGTSRSAFGFEVPEMPDISAINDVVSRASTYDLSTPETLNRKNINTGYSTVGSPTPSNIQRLSRTRNSSYKNNTEELLRQMIELLAKNSEPIIEVPVNLDGRQIAKASAKYMNSEIDNINLRKNRLGGAF